MKKKADLCITYLSIATISVMLLLNGCNDEESDQLFDENSSVQLMPAESSTEFENEIKSYFNKMLEDQATSSSRNFTVAQDDSAEVAMTSEQKDGGVAADSATAVASVAVEVSETNVVETGVDEADIVKSDGRVAFVGKQARYGYRYAVDGGSEVALGVSVNSDSVLVNDALLPEYKEPRVEPATIRILALDNKTPEAKELTAIELPKRVSSIIGLYLSKKSAAGKANQLIVVTNVRPKEARNYFQSDNTWVIAYDVSSPEKPAKQWEFEVEGRHHASRSMNGKLYLVASKSLWISAINFDSKEPQILEENKRLIENLSVNDILPATWVNGVEVSVVKARDCMIPRQTSKDTVFNSSLLTVYTIPIDAPDETKSFCTAESSSEIYASQKAIYFTKGEYIYSGNMNDAGKYYTIIHKLAYTKDSVEYKSSVRVPGWTGWRNSSFRMNESNGDLRIVVTDYKTTREVISDVIEPDFAIESDIIDESGVVDRPGDGGDDVVSISPATPVMSRRSSIRFITRPVHRLHILREDSGNDDQLYILSSLPNKERPEAIGKPGEDIYSVRFFGDYVYVVTFRRTDPLYAINLKDPFAPFIEGELKIPGYSDYLHPINSDLLLGVGKDATDNGLVQGIKVALFDVSDKSNPVTLNDIVIGERGSDTALSYNYKAFSILSDKETGVHKIALPVSVYDTEVKKHYERGDFTYYSWSYSGLQLLEIDDGSQSTVPSMKSAGVLKAAESTNDDMYYYVREPRSILVNDAVHYVENSKIWSALWDQPEVVNGPK